MSYCTICNCPTHPGKRCPKRIGITGQEMAEAERRFERGLRVGGHVMGPLDPGDTSDIWEDGW